MIVIERFYSLGEAESARLELGFHDIDSFIEHENTATLTPFLMSGRKSGIELKVSEENAEEAARILGEWQARHAAAAGNPPFASYALPAVIGAGLGLLFIKPLLVGLIVGAFIASVGITIFNHGISRGYDAARSEREDS